MPKHFGKKINDRKKGKENKEKKNKIIYNNNRGIRDQETIKQKLVGQIHQQYFFNFIFCFSLTKYRTLIFLTFSVIHFNKITTNTLPEIKTWHFYAFFNQL